MTCRLLPLSALALGALLVSGCAGVRDHRGYVMDKTLATAIQPGVDNRDSVQKTLGRPTFSGQFTDSDWYYLSRRSRRLARRRSPPSIPMARVRRLWAASAASSMKFSVISAWSGQADCPGLVMAGRGSNPLARRTLVA